MDERLRQSWDRTGAALDAVLTRLPGVAERRLTLYREYRANNELGLAFEVLVALADEEEADQQCWSALRGAADEMVLRPEDEVHGRSVAIVFSRHRE